MWLVTQYCKLLAAALVS